jgi:hypothetical protein
MPLHRIHFEEGRLMEPGEEITDFLSRTLLDSSVKISYLEPGEHNLTPDSWDSSDLSHIDHSLKVIDDDGGIYSAVPRFAQNAAAIAGEVFSEPTVSYDGALYNRLIPEETPVAFVADPPREAAERRVWEVVFYASERIDD